MPKKVSGDMNSASRLFLDCDMITTEKQRWQSWLPSDQMTYLNEGKSFFMSHISTFHREIALSSRLESQSDSVPVTMKTTETAETTENCWLVGFVIS